VLGPARMEVTVDPARTGPNAVHLYLFDRRTGAQWTAAKELTVTAALPHHGIADLPVDTRPAGPGHYTTSGAVFSVAGEWELEVTARVSDFDQYETTIDVTIR